MRYAWIAFHIVMLVLLVAAFGGAFSPPKTGNLAQDSGGSITAAIGVIVIWVVGAILFRFARRFFKY